MATCGARPPWSRATSCATAASGTASIDSSWRRRQLSPSFEKEDDVEPVKWGVISTARIGVEKVIRPMQKAGTARSWRSLARRGAARRTADKLGIPKAYGSYEALLADPEIERSTIAAQPSSCAVSIKAAEAGKHVLCEKPLALDAAEAAKLVAARDRTAS